MESVLGGQRTHGFFYGRAAVVPESSRSGEGSTLQQLIASGLRIGVSKRELLEDYYLDELVLVFEAYSEPRGEKEEDIREVRAEDW